MGAIDSGPGATRALWLSTVAFTVCFAVWTIFAIIGVRIQQDLGLNETEFGILIGTPILTGSLSRVFLGIWTDQYGGRVVYVLTMLSAAVATFLLSYATTYPTDCRSGGEPKFANVRRRSRDSLLRSTLSSSFPCYLREESLVGIRVIPVPSNKEFHR